MTDCAMFNISLKGLHPSVICVEMVKIGSSSEALLDVLSSEFTEESLHEFIEEYARTDEVMPTDKTLGFVVANAEKKIISFSFANISSEQKESITKASEKFRKAGYNVDLDF